MYGLRLILDVLRDEFRPFGVQNLIILKYTKPFMTLIEDGVLKQVKRKKKE